MENPDEDIQNSHGEMHKDRLAKNLVRLALSHELQRQPIRRQDISSKGTPHFSPSDQHTLTCISLVQRAPVQRDICACPDRVQTRFRNGNGGAPHA